VVALFVGMYSVVMRPGKLPGKGRVILISGCDSGFGHMLARDMAKEECTVLAGCLTQKAVDEWKQVKNVVPFLLDITNEASLENASKVVEANCPDGKLWALVNNAGTVMGYLFECTPTSTYRKLFEINYFGHLSLTHKVLPYLKKGQGRLVNMASMAGVAPVVSGSAYCATKYAMLGWSRSIVDELSPYGIKVIVLMPGFMKTNLISPQHIETNLDEMRKNLSEEQAKTIQHNFLETNKRLKSIGNHAGDPQWVVNAYADAILSTAPKESYMVGYDAHIVYFLLCYFPAKFTKFVMSFIAPHITLKGKE